MDCNACKEKREINPYFSTGEAMDRLCQIIRWLIIGIVILAILLVITNGAWLYAWLQYDYAGTTSEVNVDSKDGIANYVDGDVSGRIINGIGESEDEDQNQDP